MSGDSALRADREIEGDEDIIEFNMAGLPDRIGFALRLAKRAVFKLLGAALEPFDLRIVEFSVLLLVEANEGCKQQKIGTALAVKRANLVVVLDALEKRGLLRRAPSPYDRRSKALYLTHTGRALLARAKIAHNKYGLDLESALPGLDHVQLIRDLHQIARMKA